LRPQPIEQGDSSAGLRLHQVNVLREAHGREQEELVERGAPSEGKGPAEGLVAEDRDDGPADDEVLLHLGVLHPGRLAAPLGDEVPRDHASGST
jgi:hypothetical protein